jgi:serine/threonine protein kinase
MNRLGSTLAGADDEYVVEACLGGCTYRARATSSERAVAVKLLPAAGLDLAAVVDRLESCSHPNVPSFYEAFALEDSIAVVHELVDGASLEDLRQQGRRLSERETLTWIGQMLDVLAFCHMQGIVHGAVVPRHVVLREDRETFLVDFSPASHAAAAADVQALAHAARAMTTTSSQLDALIEDMLAARIDAREALERVTPLRT